MSSQSQSQSQSPQSSAEEYVNDPSVERIWLSTAVQHMQTYFNIITSLPTLKHLSLTRHDHHIYTEFRKQFADLNVKRIAEDDIKCESAKQKWRQFCNDMRDMIEDYNFGTLMRLDSRGDYSESNTIVVPRAQFIAIEIARNREGCNDGLNQIYAKTLH